MTPTLGALFARRSNNFNLIRLLAALVVIYAHAPAITGFAPPEPFAQFTGHYTGALAIDVFFLLSGFLVTGSAMSDRGLRYFMASRLLRIYPALVVCCLLTVLALGPALSASTHYWSLETWDYFWNNATAWRAQYDLPGVFASHPQQAVNGSLWSLPLEVRLYLAVLAAALLGLLRSRAWFNALAVMAVAVGYYLHASVGADSPYKYHLHSSLMFMLGSLAWMNRDRVPVSWRILVALVVATLLVRNTPAFTVLFEVLLPYAVFTLAFAPGLDGFNRVGDYSYGVYLYGWPAQQLALVAMGGDSSNAMNTLLGAAMALLVAIASWHLVEKPALALKRRFAPATPHRRSPPGEDPPACAERSGHRTG
ncbi:acyltransferase [Caenimonas koreensis]|uniref:Acyltransferase family protein n=1 Tax=Caenimonas koreensis DSM 17982 TaxID=1121255 RepID=A0A844B787_9BURK|nr:acyltransferase [Caenimonas koreensis]MRD47256.1 acyltransferase family protein [Caenimonas koreensis DSM 17982]